MLGRVVLQTKRPRLDGLGDRPAVGMAVSDTGTGMAPEVAGRAAETFFTTKPHGRGTGLGLWIAHRFASEHDGKLSIDTAPGRAPLSAFPALRRGRRICPTGVVQSSITADLRYYDIEWS